MPGKSKATIILFGISILAMFAASFFANEEVPFDRNGEVDLALDSSYEWAVDPTQFGTNSPLKGQSIFDHLFKKTIEVKGEQISNYRIPYPFKKLVVRLNSLMSDRKDGYWASGEDAGQSLVGVLIPKGRSLQRDAARETNYFRFPRIVVSTTAPTKSSLGIDFPNIKDRLFIGYQENSNILEVISYNEMAGRFEFQVIRGYDRKGTYQKIYRDSEEAKNSTNTYAMRSLCLQCHQNHGPLFSRRPWPETNGGRTNDQQLAKDLIRTVFEEDNEWNRDPYYKLALETEGNSHFYHGIKANVGEPIPNKFDRSTDKASFLSVYQALWRDGCGNSDSCRKKLLKLMVASRLLGNLKSFSANARWSSLAEDLQEQFAKVWPRGIALPNPNIVERDPYLDIKRRGKNPNRGVFDPHLQQLSRNSDVRPEHEPSNKRNPIGILSFKGSQGLYNLFQIINGGTIVDALGASLPFSGMSSSFSITDINNLNKDLEKKLSSRKKSYRGQCKLGDKYVEPEKIQYVLNCKIKIGNKSNLKISDFILEFNRGGQLLNADASFSQIIQNSKGENVANYKIYFSPIGSRYAARGKINNVGNIEGQLTLYPLNRFKSKFRGINGNLISSVSLSGSFNSDIRLNLNEIADFKSIISSIESLSTNENEHSSLHRSVLSRRKLLRDIYSKLGIEGNFNWSSLYFKLPKTNDVKINVSANSGYELVKQTCAKCHSTDSMEMDSKYTFFVAGNARASENRLKFCAERALYHINLHRFSGQYGKRMPFVLPNQYAESGGAREYIKSNIYKNLREYFVGILEGSRNLNEEIILGGKYSEPNEQFISSGDSIIFDQGPNRKSLELSQCLPDACAKDTSHLCEFDEFKCSSGDLSKLGCKWLNN